MPRAAALPAQQTAKQMRAHVGDAARLLKALANQHRLMILCLLSGGELSVGELNERVDLSQSALSQHLAVLRSDELVTTRRESQSIYYSVTPGPVGTLVAALHGIYCGKSAAKKARKTAKR